MIHKWFPESLNAKNWPSFVSFSCIDNSIMKTLKIIVETPKGSSQKYDYDRESGFFELEKILPSGMVFPYDFGFIPNTLGEDGDPLDVIVVSEWVSFAGCRINVRLLGAMNAEQSEGNQVIRNDRYLVVPELSQVYKNIRSIKDLSKKWLRDLEVFFVNYNREEGKEFKIINLAGPGESKKAIEKSRKVFKKQQD